MCLCCCAKAKTIRNRIMPDYALLKGTVDHPDWPLGYYALQNFNDPDFIFKDKPEVEPKPKRSFNTDKIAFEKWKVWADKADKFEECLDCAPETGYKLYKACLKAGYRPKRDGRLAFWLFGYLGKQLSGKCKKGL